MTAEKLKSLTVRDLAQLAKKRGVHGWHSMKKAQLVRVLTSAKLARAVSKNGKPSAVASRKLNPPRAATSKQTTASSRKAPTARPMSRADRRRRLTVERRLQTAKSKQAHSKDLARPNNAKSGRDRLVVMVRDPYWLHAYWELTRQGVERAEAAMGQDWHTARPVLRLLDVSSPGTTSSAETVVRHIEIHGGVSNWYIDVQDPPRTYRVDIGYLSANGKYFVMARSNMVSTPRAGSSDAIDNNWQAVAENFDKIYAMSGGYSAEGPSPELQELFEERLRRPMGSPMMTRFGAGVEGLLHNGKRPPFNFELDAELIVFGSTERDAHVTLQGEPVQLRPDGTFTVRFSLPNCRQVIPAVASSADGVEQRTIILALERNTKVMEPVTRDSADAT